MSFLLGVLLLASGSNPADPATSNPPTPETPVRAPTANSEDDKATKKICRLQETSDSRIGGKKICLTADQWRRVQRER